MKQSSVKGLTESVGGERTLVSHNLALLTKANLISYSKVGNTRVYSANEHIAPYVFFLLDKVVCSKCPLRSTCKALRERDAPHTGPATDQGICPECEK